jgi:hypothetical protein
MNVKLVFTLGEGLGEQNAKYNLNQGGILQQKFGLGNLLDSRVSPGIIRTIEPSRMRWVKRVARVGEKKNLGRDFV